MCWSTGLSTFLAWLHFILTMSLQGGTYYLHFPEEGWGLREVKSLAKITQWDFNPGSLTPNPSI